MGERLSAPAPRGRRRKAGSAWPEPFDLSHAPPVGVAEPLAPGLRVVTAPNAGPMTFTGTRSYIVGEARWR